MKHSISTAILVSVALSGPALGSIYTEEFTSGIPAGWTVFDNYPNGSGPTHSACTWTTNTAEGMGNFTSGTGMTAAVSSANHIGPYDIELWTPGFILPAGPNNINFKINFQRVSATEAFDTMMSLNGAPFVTMDHRTTSAGASYSSGPPNVAIGISLDFFGAAAGDICIIAFRYYDTSTSALVHNQYVEIDDLRYPVPGPGAPALAALVTASAALRRRRH